MMSMSWAYLAMYVPLLVSVACVVGATRHEKKPLILDQILRNGAWITIFMLGIYAVLQVVSWIV